MLLPFWKEVFEYCERDVSYILAMRHPLSVVKSLAKRDEFEARKSYLLWLGHVLSSLSGSEGSPRVLVDYDNVMRDSEGELGRMAYALGLTVDPEALKEFKSEFLDESLRHTTFDLDDLRKDDACPSMVRDVYATLVDIAAGKVTLDDENLPRRLKKWTSEFERLEPALCLADSLHKRLIAKSLKNAELIERIEARDNHIANLDHVGASLRQQIAALHGSTSWQITRPLRAVGYQFKRARHVAHLAIPAIRHAGGLRGMLKKAIQLCRREGFAGIRRVFRIIATATRVNPSRGSGVFDRNDYAEWIRQYDTLSDEARAGLRTRAADFASKPLISVVMPVYNPKLEYLIEAIESVRRQIYPNWELCIADDASTDTAIHSILERYTKEDPCIKVVFRKQNGHISAASNSALEIVSGEWVALLDHDDLLTEHSLFWVVDSICQNPRAQLVYSDEDKIDGTGNRFDPYFKCDWNEDLFYSHNLITHLGVYRTTLLRELDGFRVGFEGAQDYDLALRCIERIAPEQIHHIPRVLYHWRMHSGSTARSAIAKPYAMAAGQRALNEHFERTYVKGNAELTEYGYRARYALPDSPPMVSLIIPTRNGLHLLRQCIDSVRKKTTYPNYELLIVDNGSDDPETLRYLQSLKTEPGVRVLRDDSPYNFSALNNLAAREARGELVALLNNDIEVISPDWLSEMASLALQPGIGAVGAKLWYPDDTLQHGGVIVGLGGVAGHAHKHLPRPQFGYCLRAILIQSVSAVTGACLVVRRAIYEEFGGFNENELKVAFNDVDFCLRLRGAGYRNVWTPYAELYHHESASRGLEDNPEKQARFSNEVHYMKQSWGDSLLNDPAYSPNLTLDHEDFSLAWPPRVELFKPPSQITRKPTLSRVEKALIMIDRKGLGLEIGPSHNPIAPKKQGFNVQILDHASADELKKKYEGHGLNLDNIEEVDFVWHGEPFHEVVGREQCYDWIIAAHVIEHTPDFISFLTECERLLKPAGVLSLIIPDKRYCFDYLNPPTSTGEILDAFEQRRTRPSPGKVFDHFSGATKRDGKIAWDADAKGGIEFVHNLSGACREWQRARTTDEYIDVHNWRFTPASLGILLCDLQALGLTGFEIKAEFDTFGSEFYVTLSKTESPQPVSRLSAAERMLDEVANSPGIGNTV